MEVWAMCTNTNTQRVRAPEEYVQYNPHTTVPPTEYLAAVQSFSTTPGPVEAGGRYRTWAPERIELSSVYLATRKGEARLYITSRQRKRLAERTNAEHKRFNSQLSTIQRSTHISIGQLWGRRKWIGTVSTTCTAHVGSSHSNLGHLCSQVQRLFPETDFVT